MGPMPDEYLGREQSYIKHVVLERYFERWLYKLAWHSRGKDVWYVDCFAGPWETKEPKLQDTSFAKALVAMNHVAEALERDHGLAFQPRAIFVESKRSSFERLAEYVNEHSGRVKATAFHGEFGKHVGQMQRMLGRSPAFIFVDPTGWKGADMQFIAPLIGQRGRDVLINVMYEHINRFKDAEHEFLRGQMRDFFGLVDADLPSSLDEAGTMRIYRGQLRDLGRVPHVADLVVPLATSERTKFRLVVGGHHPKVLEVFREVEYEACGQVASEVRTAARDRKRDERVGAPSLFSTPAAPLDRGYATLREEGVTAVREGLPVVLEREGPTAYGKLWPRCLTKLHVRKKDVDGVVANMRRDGSLIVKGWRPRQRIPKDDQVLRLP